MKFSDSNVSFARQREDMVPAQQPPKKQAPLVSAKQKRAPRRSANPMADFEERMRLQGHRRLIHSAKVRP